MDVGAGWMKDPFGWSAENSGVKWFALEEALRECAEPWMVEWVYRKLNEKLQKEDKSNIKRLYGK